MATLQDISRRAGVSPTTASRVLNHDTTMVVGDKTRQAIFEAAFELNYMPPRRRRLASTGQMLRIGVVDWNVIYRGGANVRLSSLQYLAEIMSLANPIEFVRVTRGEVIQLDGILAFGQFVEEELQHLQQISSCIVLVNFDCTDFRYDSVAHQPRVGVQQAMESLLELSGNSPVAYIGGVYRDESCSIGLRRLESITSILKEMSLYDPSLIKVGDFSHSSGYEMMKQLLQHQLPASLVIGSDVVAMGALKALAEHNLVPGKNINVVIYFDIDTVDLPVGNYGSIRMYSDLLWQKAIQMVLEQIGGRTEMMNVSIPSRFIPAAQS